MRKLTSRINRLSALASCCLLTLLALTPSAHAETTCDTTVSKQTFPALQQAVNDVQDTDGNGELTVCLPAYGWFSNYDPETNLVIERDNIHITSTNGSLVYLYAGFSKDQSVSFNALIDVKAKNFKLSQALVYASAKGLTLLKVNKDASVSEVANSYFYSSFYSAGTAIFNQGTIGRIIGSVFYHYDRENGTSTSIYSYANSQIGEVSDCNFYAMANRQSGKIRSKGIYGSGAKIGSLRNLSMSAFAEPITVFGGSLGSLSNVLAQNVGQGVNVTGANAGSIDTLTVTIGNPELYQTTNSALVLNGWKYGPTFIGSVKNVNLTQQGGRPALSLYKLNGTTLEDITITDACAGSGSCTGEGSKGIIIMESEISSISNAQVSTSEEALYLSPFGESPGKLTLLADSTLKSINRDAVRYPEHITFTVNSEF